MPTWRDYLPRLQWGPRTVSLADDSFSPPQPLPAKPDRAVEAKEIGVAGTENFGGVIRKEDYNPNLDDWDKAVAIYDKMRRTDAMVRAVLQVIKLPLRAATWTCHPATADPVDKSIAEFCNHALFEDDSLQEGWDHVLKHILLQLDFGCSVLEKVWQVDAEGFYRYKRLAPRLPKTIKEWHVGRDGALKAVVQYAPVVKEPMPGRALGFRTNPTNPGTPGRPTPTGVSYEYLTIPARCLAVFTLEREGDNWEGNSILRNIYRNWFFKDQAYHIMGVGLDRWGVGIPIAQLEEGHTLTTDDKEMLREILQSVRANERAYMVMPEHVQFKIEPSGGGSGTAGGFGIQWLDHNDSQMARNILASFLTMGRDPRGTYGFGSRLTDMFISSLNGIASGIATDIKRQLIKPLCDVNFDMTKRKYPDPVCLDLEQVELESLIKVLAQLQGTVLTPQDEDEEVLRKMLGLPELDPNMRRDAKADAAKPEGQVGATPPTIAERTAKAVQEIAPVVKDEKTPEGAVSPVTKEQP